ncbi:hypothetical protein BCAH1134_C0373 (plasmid) [Bacillus cereus AH1134]|nr:hypothetical protein BCAH1134_C0373 [Bacillus cereus AH1134]
MDVYINLCYIIEIHRFSNNDSNLVMMSGKKTRREGGIR